MTKTMKTKHFLMMAALWCAMILVLTACSDNEDSPATGNAVVTVNTAAFYEKLGIKDKVACRLADGSCIMTDSLLIYDATGRLVSKLGMETNSLQPIAIEVSGLTAGTYTLVAWQTAYHKQAAKTWILTGEEQLSTVSLITTSSPMDYSAALGYASATVTTSDGSIKSTVTPRPMGSIVDFQVDNLTEKYGYTAVTLWDNYMWYNEGHNGLLLAPSLSDADRLINDTLYKKVDCMAEVKVGETSGKYFTMISDDDMILTLWGEQEDPKIIYNIYHQKVGFGEQLFCYIDMDKYRLQPPFFGTADAFSAWKADRDAGILVVDPLLQWGCNVADVEQHMEAKPCWEYGNDALEYWKEYDSWHKWYFVAYDLTEQYLYETETGQNLRYVLCYCWADNTPLEVANNSLLKKGYVSKGKALVPINDFGKDVIGDRFLSPDGKTDAYTYLDEDACWVILFLPHQ